MNEPLFRSAHQALLFALTFGEQSHCRAASAERQIALFGRERYERGHAAGRGLVGIDGAAQAGMIRRLVESLPVDKYLAIEARFSVLSPARQEAARAAIAWRLWGHTGLDPIVAQALVSRFYGARAKLFSVAMAADLAERTVRRRWRETRDALRVLDQSALAAADHELSRKGVIP